ncbi:hypothetical protein TSIB_0740 [Thermococcus sibiricus MM 739]|uniref:Uncharacterized protein n=1 Tax=Thermococcus sibiricus (strain DSM 12597 / MM 739) TaxID=604354 RepID=C6A2F7_THESM|nr:hypothetical protein TSIB_0740 [Thermococcus sibiricus MM 739]
MRPGDDFISKTKKNQGKFNEVSASSKNFLPTHKVELPVFGFFREGELDQTNY